MVVPGRVDGLVFFGFWFLVVMGWWLVEAKGGSASCVMRGKKKIDGLRKTMVGSEPMI